VKKFMKALGLNGLADSFLLQLLLMVLVQLMILLDDCPEDLASRIGRN